MSLERYRAAVISDVHAAPVGTPDSHWHGPIQPPANLALFRESLARLAVGELDALWLLGDLADRGDLASLTAVLGAASATGLPVRFVLGNHDVAGDGLLPQSTVTVRPAESAGESISPQLRLAGLAIEPAPDDDGYRFMSLPGDGWGDGPLVLLTHFPVFSLRTRVTNEGHKYAGDALAADQIQTALLRRSNPTVVLHGHLHLRDALVHGRVLQLGCGALAEAGHERSIVTFHVDPPAHELTVAIETRALEPDRPGPALSSIAPSWRFTGDRWLPA